MMKLVVLGLIAAAASEPEADSQIIGYSASNLRTGPDHARPGPVYNAYKNDNGPLAKKGLEKREADAEPVANAQIPFTTYKQVAPIAHNVAPVVNADSQFIGYSASNLHPNVPFGSSSGLDPITQGLDPATQGRDSFPTNTYINDYTFMPYSYPTYSQAYPAYPYSFPRHLAKREAEPQQLITPYTQAYTPYAQTYTPYPQSVWPYTYRQPAYTNTPLMPAVRTVGAPAIQTIKNYNNPEQFTVYTNGMFGSQYLAKNGPVEHLVKREAEAEPEADAQIPFITYKQVASVAPIVNANNNVGPITNTYYSRVAPFTSAYQHVAPITSYQHVAPITSAYNNLAPITTSIVNWPGGSYR